MFKVAQREGAIGEANRLLQKERWNAGDRGGREGGGDQGAGGPKGQLSCCCLLVSLHEPHIPSVTTSDAVSPPSLSVAEKSHVSV